GAASLETGWDVANRRARVFWSARATRSGKCSRQWSLVRTVGGSAAATERTPTDAIMGVSCRIGAAVDPTAPRLTGGLPAADGAPRTRAWDDVWTGEVEMRRMFLLTAALGCGHSSTPVAISPDSGSALTCSQVRFQATGGPVQWSVDGGVGSIDASGLYTAP